MIFAQRRFVRQRFIRHRDGGLVAPTKTRSPQRWATTHVSVPIESSRSSSRRSDSSRTKSEKTTRRPRSRANGNSLPWSSTASASSSSHSLQSSQQWPFLLVHPRHVLWTIHSPPLVPKSIVSNSSLFFLQVFVPWFQLCLKKRKESKQKEEKTNQTKFDKRSMTHPSNSRNSFNQRKFKCQHHLRNPAAYNSILLKSYLSLRRWKEQVL